MKTPHGRRAWLLGWCLGAAACAFGQLTPGPMVGEMPTPGFGAAPQATNLTLLSLSSNSMYDDNFSNGASRHEGGGQQQVTATFGFQQTRRRLRWNLSYRPGLVVGAHSLLGNQFNQVFGTTFEAQPTARWSLKLRQDYSLTTDPFERLGEAALQPGLSPLDKPNELTVLPPLRRTASFTAAGVSYRLSRHLTAGLTGSYALQHYSEYAGGWTGALINNRAATASSYLSRQVSRRYTTGLEYRLRNLAFPGYGPGARTHSILSFHQFAVTANSSFIFYGGPEYARTRGQMENMRNLPASVSWSPAAGAIYTWSGMRNRLQVGYSRQISDGGGLQGAVRLNAGWLRVGRQLGPRWSADLSSELAQQTALGTGGTRLRRLGAGAGLRRELGRNATLRLSYDRLYQQGSALGYRPGNHNRVMLSLEQTFMHPLGR